MLQKWQNYLYSYVTSYEGGVLAEFVRWTICVDSTYNF